MKVSTDHPQPPDLMLLLGFDVFPEYVPEHGALALVFLELLRLVATSVLLEVSGEGQPVSGGAEGQQRQRPHRSIPEGSNQTTATLFDFACSSLHL